MPTVSLKAHYDGEKIVLDEPFDLPLHSSLLVMLVHPSTAEIDEKSGWNDFSADQLSKAYGDTEPEYTLADLKPT